MSGFKTLFTINAMLAAAASFGSTTKDDSSWINSGIYAAIANGQNSFSIAAGTYTLQHPITIPQGTRNFTLKGAGSSKTILTAPIGALNEFINVGTVVSGYWPFTKYEQPLTQNVKTGQTVLYVKPGTPIAVGHYIDLFDTYIQHPNTDPTVCEATHSELVKVKAYNTSTGAITIDTKTCREYTNPYVADIDALTCANVTVQGFGFNGAVTGSKSTTCTFVADQLTDYFYGTDLVGSNYTVAAVETDNSRNVLLNHCVGNVASDASSGGYTFYIESSHYVTVENCVAKTAQHGFEVHGGSTDVVFNYCTGTSAPFDLHGMDDRRVMVENSVGDFSSGNAAWANGDSAITLTNDKFGITHLCAYTNGVTATSSTFTDQVWLDSSLHNVTNPAPAQAPTNLSFTSCVVTAPYYDVPNDQVGGKMTFSKCTLDSSQSSWGYCLNWTAMNGASIDLESCTLNMSTNGYPAVSLSGTNISFKMNNCSVVSGGTASYGVMVGSTYTGSLYFGNDSFTSKAKSPALLSNKSKVQPQGSSS